jgi:hypothetical protein
MSQFKKYLEIVQENKEIYSEEFVKKFFDKIFNTNSIEIPKEPNKEYIEKYNKNMEVYKATGDELIKGSAFLLPVIFTLAFIFNLINPPNDINPRDKEFLENIKIEKNINKSDLNDNEKKLLKSILNSKDKNETIQNNEEEIKNIIKKNKKIVNQVIKPGIFSRIKEIFN